MTTVALLEDEADLREEIADFLGARGHRVRRAQVPRPDAARQAVAGVVGVPNHLVRRVEPVDRDERPKHLLRGAPRRGR